MKVKGRVKKQIGGKERNKQPEVVGQVWIYSKRNKVHKS